MSNILESALRITAFGPQFKSVLKTKLRVKGYLDTEIDNVIIKLESLELLDDFKVTKLYVTTQVKNKFYGPNLIRAKLFEKGVDKEIVESIIKEIFFDIEEETDVCLKCFNKFITEKEKSNTSKIYRKLQSKGFSMRAIKNVVATQLDIEVDDDIR
ncbi:MAG: hypothetical protein A2015_04390 [Spirochaetes bacterium GWF1_31_7]|nr:MAG: hypothetical protein A2Y30_16880 [Spirochaetes bacterium GWE1_32_154]OHD52591.1 MAG: hypothetical protein A2Y29_00070 [Spirochaetes bacterium GWE2_31_10]OHD52959.1 MAG: hypothetical protein A2015_04390 [Spirochaetes bacterium GWF1_31_7]OHD80237.1 MAG: hypothetical protein A2355_07165 [Spirochaetes bacterium RIFOXYB1_FULL_32_8]HBD93703.1 hypothetical protein [Spirochaetia bacterium]